MPPVARKKTTRKRVPVVDKETYEQAKKGGIPVIEKAAELGKLDKESELAIYQGVNLTQIGSIFSMDSRDVKEKLLGRVVPVGKREGRDVYSIKECAPYLVRPPYDLDEFIQRMSIADLPPILRKEYWAGLRSRQLYEKEAAELWPTAQVVDAVAELLKTMRLSLLLSREKVERETELTERQRNIITGIIDNALEQAHANVTRRFAERNIEVPVPPPDLQIAVAPTSDEDEL